MNKLSRDKCIQIINQVIDGMSLRAITRSTSVSINTVTKLSLCANEDETSAHQEFRLEGAEG
jgi:hypothetical protein